MAVVAGAIGGACVLTASCLLTVWLYKRHNRLQQEKKIWPDT